MAVVIAPVIVFTSGYAETLGDRSQIGTFIGKLLPSNIEGVNEVASHWGLRYSHSLGSLFFAEGGGVFGNSGGANWRGLFTSIRMDLTLETLTGLAYLGLDYTNYDPDKGSTVNKGGAHMGGGVMSLIGGNVFVRFDMKLNSKPGTSLFFAFGLSYAF